MPDSFFSQIKARGEEFFTEVSNNLMSNPRFIEVLKKGIEVKEEVDKRVAEALKTMNVATRKDVQKLQQQLAELQAELAAMKAKASAAARGARKATSKRR